jgi:hypothetical protein
VVAPYNTSGLITPPLVKEVKRWKQLGRIDIVVDAGDAADA